MDSTEGTTDFQAPCNCGALGDHPRNPNCAHTSQVQIEVTGPRSACLEALGVLRASYHVFPEHEWQDPDTEQWVFKIGAARNYWRPLAPPPVFTAPVPPTPQVAVLACLNNPVGLEIGEEEIRVLTGLSEETLAGVLTDLVNTGAIEHVTYGVYRKNA
ncbi:hypothetical protein [Streptomyces sp. NBC_01264]|uniref:hypothetical protein n=1 Tax=Streptomyces sp. NBC_01264 TaxID=2903804 RepID=UPI002252860A|nr:hypothetical protein [Streptomyces sp. NBC_01264]MCX4784470.1 hypothetical protein [Streptomyces sp. NBC_01264]